MRTVTARLKLNRGLSAATIATLLICSGTLLAWVRPTFVAPQNSAPSRSLSFADRVRYQRAIEQIYWQHRIWPKQNARPKPSLDEVMPAEQIQKKVEDYLRNSQALEDYWQRPITPDQLQAEMERIASHTKQSGVLREIFAALGNDPFVIAECLARPVLAERLITELYAHDQRFQGELKRRAEAELRTHPSVTQMKQTSGMYTEMELARSDSGDADSANTDGKNAGDSDDLALSDAPSVVATPLRGVGGAPNAIRISGNEWRESVEKLAAEFGTAKAGDSWGQIKTGVLSPLREDDGHYYAVAVMNKGKDRLKLATVAWLKEPLRSWLAKAEAKVPTTMAAVTANYTLPVISAPSGGCADDTWTPTSTTNAPIARRLHTAIWTGSEMIVWGGAVNGPEVNTGGRYNPSTDSWTATSTTNAPEARIYHTAVWTGSEMIVWGGLDGITLLNTGGRYNPSTDTWIATSTTNAPIARELHTAVWTGGEMIVWGGAAVGAPNTGGRYNPGTDSWTATSTINAPSGRFFHTAVWTGSEMIVWGGDDNSNFFNTGGRYNPGTDSWVATSTISAPASRQLHTAVWTGSEMIVWGGGDGMGNSLNTGGRYNPSTNSWAATSVTNAPAARTQHTAVWSGSEMIVWGGDDATFNNTNTGGRYSPTGDSWVATNLGNAPSPRDSHSAVWSGSEMIVWGGIEGGVNHLNTGGRYCAQGGPTPTPAPVIISPLTATATVGQQFTYQFLAPGATSLSVSNLPAGLTFNPSLAAITGIPTAPGTFQVGLSASNGVGTTTATLVLTVQSLPAAGPIVMSVTSATGRTGSPFSFQVITSGGSSLARVSATGLPVGLSIDSVTGEISGTVTTDGSSSVTLTVTEAGITNTATLQLTFTSDLAVPVIVSPNSALVFPGLPFSYTILAPTSDSSDPVTYSEIGPLPPGLGLDPVTGIISGTPLLSLGLQPTPSLAGGVVTNVQIFACNSSGCAAQGLFFLLPTGAANISTRLSVGTGDNVLIGGFITQGNAPMKLVVRGIGPSLPLAGVLADPFLDLHSGAASIASNDNWKDNLAGGSQEIAIENTGLAPTNSLESAILSVLDPGAYTAIMNGTNNGTGVGLVEVYNLGAASMDVSSEAQLANISTRGNVQTGDNVMIGGFINQGSVPIKVLVRGIGPSLTQFGVSGALANPILELHKPDGSVVTNDDWMTDPTQKADIMATGLAPANELESAILLTLPVGERLYTAIVSGVNGTTGVGLVEAYFGNPCLGTSCP